MRGVGWVVLTNRRFPRLIFTSGLLTHTCESCVECVGMCVRSVCVCVPSSSSDPLSHSSLLCPSSPSTLSLSSGGGDMLKGGGTIVIGGGARESSPTQARINHICTDALTTRHNNNNNLDNQSKSTFESLIMNITATPSVTSS